MVTVLELLTVSRLQHIFLGNVKDSLYLERDFESDATKIGHFFTKHFLRILKIEEDFV